VFFRCFLGVFGVFFFSLTRPVPRAEFSANRRGHYSSPVRRGCTCLFMVFLGRFCAIFGCFECQNGARCRFLHYESAKNGGWGAKLDVNSCKMIVHFFVLFCFCFFLMRTLYRFSADFDRFWWFFGVKTAPSVDFRIKTAQKTMCL
jgi:hypothetical protein